MNARMLRHIVIALLLTAVSPFILPAQDAAWHYTGCPDGGNVTGIAVLPTGEIFASTLLRGLFRSLDSGASWEMTDAPVYADANTICGGGTHPLCMLNSAMLYLSTDRGLHWSRTSVTGMATPIIDSTGMFFAVIGGEIYRTDDGNNWMGLVTVPLPAYYTLCLAAGTGGHVFVAGSNDTSWVMRSTDGGHAWSVIRTSGLPKSNILALAAAPDNTLYIRTALDGIVRSTDDGATWTSTGIGSMTSSLSVTATGTVVVGLYDAIMISTDRGASWTRQPIPASELLNCVAATSTGRLLADFASAGIYSFDGAGPWQWASYGLSANNVVTISTGDHGTLYAVAGNDRRAVLERSTDGGRTWSAPLLDVNGVDAPAVTTGADAVVALGTDPPTQRVNRSTDAGTTWARPASNLGGLLSPLYLTSDGALYASVTGSAIMRSTDDGRTWRQFVLLGADSTITGAALAGDHLVISFKQNLATTRSDGVMLLAPSTGVRIATVDLGSRPIDHLLQTPRGTLVAVGTAYSVGQGNVLRSTDGGASWEQPADVAVQAPVAGTVDSLGRVYVSTLYRTVAYSDDECRTWRVLDDGLDSLTLIALAADRLGTIYGSSYRGVYATTHVAAVASGDRESIGAMRVGITPNPAVTGALLHLELDRAATVSVRLYDALGREALTLPPVHLDQGLHTVPVPAAELRAGVYLCSVAAGHDVCCVRLVIAR